VECSDENRSVFKMFINKLYKMAFENFVDPKSCCPFYDYDLLHLMICSLSPTFRSQKPTGCSYVILHTGTFMSNCQYWFWWFELKVTESSNTQIEKKHWICFTSADLSLWLSYHIIARHRNPNGFLPEVWSPLQATVHGIFCLPWHRDHGFY
jgi:hypothetical protein